MAEKQIEELKHLREGIKTILEDIKYLLPSTPKDSDEYDFMVEQIESLEELLNYSPRKKCYSEYISKDSSLGMDHDFEFLQYDTPF